MPTNAELLVDTSVAVALSVADHDGRTAARAAVEGRRIGLAGHAAFETYSLGGLGRAAHRLDPRRGVGVAATLMITARVRNRRHLAVCAPAR